VVKKVKDVLKPNMRLKQLSSDEQNAINEVEKLKKKLEKEQIISDNLQDLVEDE